MDWQKIFISHSGQDNNLIDQFATSLRAIGSIPFLAERFPATGENVPEKIAEHIRDSNAFVPFITRASLGNQWVNQEIGYAYCWMKTQSKDPPYFFPIVEDGLGQSVKGFLGIPATEYIPLMISEPKLAIHDLLLGLRKYVDRYLSVFEKLVIKCPNCKREFSEDIPPQRDIEEAIRKKEPLETECTICKRRVSLNPYTLVAEASIGGHRW
jgi:hypothetical protein